MTGVHLTTYRTDPETGDIVPGSTSNGPWYSLVPLHPRGADPVGGSAIIVGDRITDSVLFLGDHTHVLTAQQRQIIASRLPGVTLPAGTTAGDAVLHIRLQGPNRMPPNRPDGGWEIRLGDLVIRRNP